MATQIISSNSSTGVSVAFADTVYLAEAATITISSVSGAAIGSATTTAFSSSLVLAGDVVHLGNSTSLAINLRGTGNGLSSGVGAHTVTMADTSRILATGTCISALGSSNSFFLDGNLTGNTGVTNTGANALVQQTGTVNTRGSAIVLSGGGRVWNSGTIEAGFLGVTVTGDGSTLNNTGLIKSGSTAMEAAGGGLSMVNAGTLFSSSGIVARGDGSTIVNSGAITARTTGINAVATDGSFLNTVILNAGALTSNGVGIGATNGDVRVRNTDTITANTTGVSLAGDTKTNLNNTGTISGQTAVRMTANVVSTLQNAGKISGDEDGVAIGGPNAIISNSSTGSIQGRIGIRSDAAFFNLTNQGSIDGSHAGVFSSGQLVLANHGQIAGVNFGVNLESVADSDGVSHRLTNSGRIAGDSAILATLFPGPSTGHIQITNSGTIAGNSAGIVAENYGMTVANTGQITATGVAVMSGFQSVIDNQGLIATGEAATEGAAILLGIGDDVVRNFGTISGALNTGASADRVRNEGLITGDVFLGDGSDGYNGRPGRNAGVIDGGTGNDTIRAGDGDDRLIGNAGNDSLFGNGGDDDLIGSGGSDSIFGGAGDDTVTGGGGRDFYELGAGADVFVLLAAADSGPAAADTVGDFAAGTDSFDLRALGSGGTFIGEAAFGSIALQVRYSAATGTLQGDVNGDGAADWAVKLSDRPALTAGDFLF